MISRLGKKIAGYAVLALTFNLTIHPSLAQTPDAAERGRYLAIAADCTACHTAPGGKTFAGGYAMSTPVGVIYSTNITSSKRYGIGSYSRDDFEQAVRHGYSKRFGYLYPAMPYTAYAKISDNDIDDLYAFFKTVPAVDDRPDNVTNLRFPFSMRWQMAIWNTLYVPTHPFSPDRNQSEEVNRGAYLVQALQHCSTCHTPRDFLMGEDMHQFLGGATLGQWYAPNITSNTVSGIGTWSIEDISSYLRSGRLVWHGQAGGPMAEAVTNSLQYLSESDLKAMAAYLKQIRPVRTGIQTQSRYEFGQAQSLEPEVRGVATADPGETLFSSYCASCHQPDGLGTKDQFYPMLFNNSATGLERADNLIATIAFGINRSTGKTTHFMPGFGAMSYVNSLSDQEVADIVNFVMQRYGNPTVKVTAEDVKLRLAGGPTPELVALADYWPLFFVLGFIAILIIAGYCQHKRHVRNLQRSAPTPYVAS